MNTYRERMLLSWVNALIHEDAMLTKSIESIAGLCSHLQDLSEGGTSPLMIAASNYSRLLVDLSTAAIKGDIQDMTDIVYELYDARLTLVAAGLRVMKDIERKDGQ